MPILIITIRIRAWRREMIVHRKRHAWVYKHLLGILLCFQRSSISSPPPTFVFCSFPVLCALCKRLKTHEHSHWLKFSHTVSQKHTRTRPDDLLYSQIAVHSRRTYQIFVLPFWVWMSDFFSGPILCHQNDNRITNKSQLELSAYTANIWEKKTVRIK